MVCFGVLFLLLTQVTSSSAPLMVPEKSGVYLLADNSDWVALQPAVVSDADAKGMDLFVSTGGYTDFGMHVACRGPRASIRILRATPTFYVRGIDSTKDSLLVRLTKKKDRRVFKTSFSNVTVGNKGGFRKKDIFKLNKSENSDGSFSLTSEKDLPAGEYMLVFGNASTVYDFGVDRAR